MTSTVFAACGGSAPGADGQADPAGHAATRGESSKPRVVCTTVMIGDLVEELCADEFDVTTLFGPDVDPHLFRPDRSDVKLLRSADLVVYSGFHLEGYLVDEFESLRDMREGPQLFVFADEIQRACAADPSAPEIDPSDPHLWMDVSLWSRAVGPLAAVLEGLQPEGGAPRRAELLEKRLARLHTNVQERLSTVAPEARVLVTAHDAFHYFGRAYGVEVHAVQGMSTASEAGLRAVDELVGLLVSKEVPAVFFESSVSDRNVRALVEGAAARDHSVAVGGVLHSDAPGDAGSYEAMIRHNVETIAAALGTRPGAEVSR